MNVIESVSNECSVCGMTNIPDRLTMPRFKKFGTHNGPSLAGRKNCGGAIFIFKNVQNPTQHTPQPQSRTST